MRTRDDHECPGHYPKLQLRILTRGIRAHLYKVQLNTYFDRSMIIVALYLVHVTFCVLKVFLLNRVPDGLVTYLILNGIAAKELQQYT